MLSPLSHPCSSNDYFPIYIVIISSPYGPRAQLVSGISVIAGWHEKYPDVPLFNPSEIINDLVARNKLGRKTGEGFYKYD